MSRVTIAQTSFNGGEVSHRLRARRDQSIYGIAVKELTGFAPLVEGPAEAMPGLLHVEQAPGPFRAIRFEYNKTQGHVIEASDYLWRIYTNDGLLLGLPGPAPVQVVSPYSYAQMLELRVWADYDTLYCYHPAVQTRKFVRTDATTFVFELHEYRNGPFDARNEDRTHTISASATAGAVSLTTNKNLFAATDVGRLVQFEVIDFGDTPAWEPGVTVPVGTLRTSLERVYRAATAGTTGSWQPSHTEGLEWDGSKVGVDINGKPAGGVQWEYLHDKIGIVKITGYTNAQNVTGTVVRNLPFSTVAGVGSGNYAYEGGYWESGWTEYSPPMGAVAYQYGTWRWRLGLFSNTSGWPQCGCIWAERHCVGKDNVVAASVAGDLGDHASFNEFGDISADMAVLISCDDPNVLEWMAPDERLLMGNASGTFALGPDNPAAGFGPKNRRLRRQNHAPSGSQPVVQSDGQTLFIDKSGGRIYQVTYDPGQINQPAIDMTRYARHMGNKARRFVELAPQRTPHNHIWAVRADGTLACANFLPEEEVLGWANRPLADGVLAKTVATITDPAGEMDQVWVGVTYAGQWHMCLMAPWREDGDYDDNAVMVDLARVHDGAPINTITHPLLANQEVDLVADGRFYLARTLDNAGSFDLEVPASTVVVGKRYPAAIEQLAIEAGGDNGPAISKSARFGRAWVQIEHGRGLLFGGPDELVPIEDQALELAWSRESGFRFIEAAADHDRSPRLRLERIAPAQCTVLAMGGTVEVQQK